MFPGNIASPDALAKYQKFGQNLTSKEGPIRMYTPKAEDMDAVIQVLTIFSTHHREVQYMAQSLPEVFVPRTRPYGVQCEWGMCPPVIPTKSFPQHMTHSSRMSPHTTMVTAERTKGMAYLKRRGASSSSAQITTSLECTDCPTLRGSLPSFQASWLCNDSVVRAVYSHTECVHNFACLLS